MHRGSQACREGYAVVPQVPAAAEGEQANLGPKLASAGLGGAIAWHSMQKKPAKGVASRRVSNPDLRASNPSLNQRTYATAISYD